MGEEEPNLESHLWSVCTVAGARGHECGVDGEVDGRSVPSGVRTPGRGTEGGVDRVVSEGRRE